MENTFEKHLGATYGTNNLVFTLNLYTYLLTLTHSIYWALSMNNIFIYYELLKDTDIWIDSLIN